MKIEIIRKFAYGRERFYPISDDAKFMTEVIGRPSLTRRQLNLFKKRQWEIVLKIPQHDETFGEDE